MAFYTGLFWGLFGFFLGSGAAILFTFKKRTMLQLVALAVAFFVLFFVGGLLGVVAGVLARLYVLSAPRK